MTGKEKGLEKRLEMAGKVNFPGVQNPIYDSVY
jgi:hypothetical protein